MDREEATEALALLKRVIGQARDDTTLQNWGWLWVIHGLTNCGAFVITDRLLRAGHFTPGRYVLLWIGTIGFNFLTIFVLKGERGGVRSFVENQIWVIWTSFIVLSAVACVVNWWLGLDRLFAGIAMGLLASFAFSMMGGVMGRRWFLWAAVCLAATLAMVALPDWQFTVLGVLWGVMQTGGGVLLLFEKRRRLASGTGAPHLV